MLIPKQGYRKKCIYKLVESFAKLLKRGMVPWKNSE